MRSLVRSQHLSDRLDAAPRRRATHQAESEPPDDLGDQLSIRMLADENMNVWPSVMVGEQQNVLVPESVNESVAQARQVGASIDRFIMIAITQRPDPDPH